MRRSTTLLLAAAALLLACATAQARISHGYSGLLTIDTVTAVNDDASSLPQATALATIYPNPFNPRTVIAFELAETGPFELAIYDLGGRLVRVLEAGTQAAGRHEATWDGQDHAGRAVPTGTYFCRLSTAQGSQTMKLTLAR
ncbi:MAG: T9SS type A sorting domain-containing protein [bacterium]|nr:T9SS type A sorting domain-containing protein [bacterium]